MPMDHRRRRSCQATAAPLSSRDGFVLLTGGGDGCSGDDHLRLCDAVAETCKVIPVAALDDLSMDNVSYVLVTGNDIVSPPPAATNSSAVWILAVKRGKKEDVKPGITYQIFSGEWGPVKRSARLERGWSPAFMYGEPKDMVVCRGGVVYWLGESFPNVGRSRRVAFALDVFTERAWITELPEKYGVVVDRSRRSRHPLLSLATSSKDDGRLSLIASLRDYKIEVWVLMGDGRWALRRGIEWLRPYFRRTEQVRITVFCPRSGCLFGDTDSDKFLLIPIDGDLPRLFNKNKHDLVSCYPYEMDWSTYVSRMKYF